MSKNPLTDAQVAEIVRPAILAAGSDPKQMVSAVHSLLADRKVSHAHIRSLRDSYSNLSVAHMNLKRELETAREKASDTLNFDSALVEKLTLVSAEVAKRESEIAELSLNIQNLNTQLSSEQKNSFTLKGELSKAKQQVTVAVEANVSLRNKLSSTEEERKLLERASTTLAESLRETQAKVSSLVDEIGRYKKSDRELREQLNDATIESNELRQSLDAQSQELKSQQQDAKNKQEKILKLNERIVFLASAVKRQAESRRQEKELNMKLADEIARVRHLQPKHLQNAEFHHRQIEMLREQAVMTAELNRDLSKTNEELKQSNENLRNRVVATESRAIKAQADQVKTDRLLKLVVYQVASAIDESLADELHTSEVSAESILRLTDSLRKRLGVESERDQILLSGNVVNLHG